MKIPRTFQNLDEWLKPNKVLVLFGARQVGKTTLLRDYLSTCNLKYKLDSGDDIRVQEVLGSQDFGKIQEYAQNYELIAIDEAQRIQNIGHAFKIMVDQIPGIKIIATGSSSFELAGQIGEPLTGRKTTLSLFPVSQAELLKLYNPYELRNRLDEYLIYGGYPEVITSNGLQEKKQILNEIANLYLLKDIFELEKVKSPKILLNLLRLLAFQIGGEVAQSELAKQLGIDQKTVARYLDLFEKAFVICNLRGFSRNLRNEISRKSKYYFCDNGIRNAIISNFNTIELRDDAGKLWENFLVTERLKKQGYQGIYANNFFWRTWTQKEIDMVEERNGRLYGYEFKWGMKTPKPPKEWLSTYANSEFQVINKENYIEFIT